MRLSSDGRAMSDMRGKLSCGVGRCHVDRRGMMLE